MPINCLVTMAWAKIVAKNWRKMCLSMLKSIVFHFSIFFENSLIKCTYRNSAGFYVKAGFTWLYDVCIVVCLIVCNFIGYTASVAKDQALYLTSFIISDY